MANNAPFYEKYPDCHDLSGIPGTYGVPIAGITIGLFSDWDGTCGKIVEQYGHVARIQLGPFKGVLLSHADDIQKVLLNQNKEFSNKMGWAGSLGIFFDGGILLRDFDDHKFHRRMFQTAFKNHAMRGYTDVAADVVEHYMEKWENEREINFTEAVRQPLLDMASRIFFGIDDLQGENNQRMVQAFIDVIHKGTQGFIKWDIPGFKHHTGMKANRFLDRSIAELIPSRRGKEGTDFMTFLVNEKDENGNSFTDEELIAHLKFLMFASFDTTSTTLAFIIMHLARDQMLQERVRKEAVDSGKEILDFDDLESMKLMDNCILESTRMYPPLAMSFRRTIRPVKLGDYMIPPHTLLFMNFRYPHYSEEFWSNPQEFDPDRFDEPRAEHKQHSFAYVGFGGGAHKCIGMHFAKMEAKLFLHRFLKKYRVRLAPGANPQAQIFPLPEAKDLRVILEKID